jgi:hypothetical protein
MTTRPVTWIVKSGSGSALSRGANRFDALAYDQGARTEHAQNGDYESDYEHEHEHEMSHRDPRLLI